MKIQLKNWRITQVNFSLLAKNEKRDENTFNLESGNYFSDNKDDRTFDVDFKLTVFDTAFDLVVEASYTFEVLDEAITEEFKLSSFPRINAPAIAFPFLRAFISNLTLQAGMKPVILPSINFVELDRNSRE